MLEINYHYDAGHGWYEVNKALLVNLCVDKEISGYSYMKDEMAYLEEDCDASVLVKALGAAMISYRVCEINNGNDSKIRGYKRYKAVA